MNETIKSVLLAEAGASLLLAIGFAGAASVALDVQYASAALACAVASTAAFYAAR